MSAERSAKTAYKLVREQFGPWCRQILQLNSRLRVPMTAKINHSAAEHLSSVFDRPLADSDVATKTVILLV